MTLLTLDYVRTTIKTHDIDVQWAHDTLLKSARNLVSPDQRVQCLREVRQQSAAQHRGAEVATADVISVVSGEPEHPRHEGRVELRARQRPEALRHGQVHELLAVLLHPRSRLHRHLRVEDGACVHYETILKEK